MDYVGPHEDEESRRYVADVNYRIEKAGMDRARARLTYVEQIYPNTLPGRVAFQEALAVAGVALVFLVLPALGLMWLDQPDGFDDARWVWLAYATGLLVVGLVQCGRSYQATRAHQDVIQRTWARFKKEGWPPLTDIEEAGHGDTTPQRLLELANSTSLDVLIVVGENPNLAPAGLDLLSRHPDVSVQLRAAWSTRTPGSAVEQLLGDPDERVREAARKTLGKT